MVGSANAAALLQMTMADMQQRQALYGGGCGCYPPPPCPYPINTGHGNLPNANVGWHGFFNRTDGYGLDLNNNGRYDRGQDGVLAFDLNRDGKLSGKEIEESRDRLKAFGGNYDFNNDGKVNFCERARG
ncbi:MAG: hypothetical protein AB1758_31400, partial [Candidatus Eremiobacterota bacterium]